MKWAATQLDLRLPQPDLILHRWNLDDCSTYGANEMSERKLVQLVAPEAKRRGLHAVTTALLKTSPIESSILRSAK